MNEAWEIPVSNRFAFLAQLKDKLHQRGCDLATYKSNGARSHYRDPEDINPEEYAILGPVIGPRKKFLGFMVGPYSASKVLCNVITKYVYEDALSIDKIKFYVFGQENIDLVKKIIIEDYAPLHYFVNRDFAMIIVASLNSNVYENYH